MPYLRIQTNTKVDSDVRTTLLSRCSQVVAEMLGKPESYVMVHLEDDSKMMFAGGVEPLAYLELKSLGMPEERTGDFSRCLCSLMREELGIEPSRVYIEFSSPPRHMWGWNGGTF